MNNIRDNRQESEDERFSETGSQINKDIVAPKQLSQIPVVREDCQIVQTAFHRFKRQFRDCRRRPSLCCVTASVTMVPRHSSNHGVRKNSHMQEPIRTYYRKSW